MVKKANYLAIEKIKFYLFAGRIYVDWSLRYQEYGY